MRRAALLGTTSASAGSFRISNTKFVGSFRVPTVHSEQNLSESGLSTGIPNQQSIKTGWRAPATVSATAASTRAGRFFRSGGSSSFIIPTETTTSQGISSSPMLKNSTAAVRSLPDEDQYEYESKSQQIKVDTSAENFSSHQEAFKKPPLADFNSRYSKTMSGRFPHDVN